jgi:hypothetical protein
MNTSIKNLYSLLQGKSRKVAWAVVPIVVVMLTLLLFLAGSCKKSENESIIGSWKLVELRDPRYTDYENQIIVNCVDSNIIFTFKENNTLLITGNMQGGYLPEGEYNYTYRVIKGTLKSMPGPNLIINNERYFATVSEQATKLGIFNEWSIQLIK